MHYSAIGWKMDSNIAHRTYHTLNQAVNMTPYIEHGKPTLFEKSAASAKIKCAAEVDLSNKINPQPLTNTTD